MAYLPANLQKDICIICCVLRIAFDYHHAPRGDLCMYNHAPPNYDCPFCLLVQKVESEHNQL